VDPALLAAAALAGAIVVLTPGPAVLALFQIGTAQGRRAGAGFIVGHLAGDLVWAALALVALAGAQALSPLLFKGLAAFCGVYLFWLGWRSLTVRPVAAGRAAVAVDRPRRRGIVFGLSNPKSYPVTLSVLGGLLAGSVDAIPARLFPLVLAAMFAGFVLADLVLIWIVGTAPLRRLYRERETWILRGTGALFIGFAVNTLANL
jgi:threonine/homoserine/homoserine lactone efflux protein